MKQEFAVILNKHRILGPIFNTVILSKKPDSEFLVIADRLSSSNLNKYESMLSSEAVRLVRIMDEYGDNQLLKVFSRKKTSIHDFLSASGSSFINDHIRPYIERRLSLCIEILSGNEIPVFYKKQLNNIYETDRIDIPDEPAEAEFSFARKPEGIYYSLNIRFNEESISLTGKEGFIMVNDPCIVCESNRMLMIRDIDGKKLLPFFRTGELFIKQETEKKFLETFAKKVIQKYNVKAEGFGITDRYVTPKPVLYLENNLAGKPAFILHFIYEEKTKYEANRRSELQVKLKYSEDSVEFVRLNRNPDYENSVISSLLEMGLANTEISSFIPLTANRSSKNSLIYDLAEWINENSSKVGELGIGIFQNTGGDIFYTGTVDFVFKVGEQEHDWFDINAKVVLNGYEVPFIEMKDNILNGIREYKLPGGEIFILPEAWFAKFREILTFAGEKEGRLTLEKQHFPLLENLQEVESSWAEKMKSLLQEESVTDIAIPGEVHATLRNYQKKGFRWLWLLNSLGFGGCLADDMGLGKTLQTLAVISKYIRESGAGSSGENRRKPVLVVVPASLVHNWINEACRFVPSVRTAFYGGQNRNTFSYYYDNFDLIITSYGMVRHNPDVIKDAEFSYVILDEAQVIKNPRSKTYKALIDLKSENRIILTGTPIENSLSDLWAQMNFLNAGLLGGYEFFKREFIVPVEKAGDPEKTGLLKKLIAPFVMRRTKAEVAPELPELSRQLIYCEMSGAQQDFYETEKSKVRNLLLEKMTEPDKSNYSFVVLQSMTKLRQAANHPVLIDPDYREDSGKFNVVIENIHNLIAEKHKVLLFSSFVKHLDIFSGYCDRNNIPYSRLTGEVPQGRREKVITDFTEDKNVFLFFISIKAGGYGLNLTAADYVFILDPWWNPAVEEQALSRAYRIGQQNRVFVYRFITKDTIEDKIRTLQGKKSDLAEKFTGTGNPFAAGDREELIKLVE